MRKVLISHAIILLFTVIFSLGVSAEAEVYVTDYQVTAADGITEISEILPGDVFDLTINFADINQYTATNPENDLEIVEIIKPSRALIKISQNSPFTLGINPVTIPKEGVFSYEPFEYSVTFDDVQYTGDGKENTLLLEFTYLDGEELIYQTSYIRVPNPTGEDAGILLPIDTDIKSQYAIEFIIDAVSEPAPPVATEDDQDTDDDKDSSSTEDNKDPEPLEVVPPVIIMNSVNYGEEDLIAGDTFTLNVVSKNVSDILGIEDLVVTAVLPEGVILQESCSGCEYFDVVNPGNLITSNFNLEVLPSVTDSTLSIAVTYEGYHRDELQNLEKITETHIVSLPLTDKERFEIFNVDVPESLPVGEEGVMSVSVVNKGNNDVNNISVELTGEIDVEEDTVWVGNLKSGEAKEVKFYMTADDASTVNGNIHVNYENASEKSKTITAPFVLDVINIQPEELLNTAEGTDFQPTDTTESQTQPQNTGISNVWIYLASLAVLICGVIIGILSYKLSKLKSTKT